MISRSLLAASFAGLIEVSFSAWRGDDVGVAFVAVQTAYEDLEHNTLEAARETARRFGLDIPIGHDAGPDGKGSTGGIWCRQVGVTALDLIRPGMRKHQQSSMHR